MYIRPDKLPKLKEYKYSGVDHSLTSRYILKPFYTHVVIKCFPMSMAYVIKPSDGDFRMCRVLTTRLQAELGTLRQAKSFSP